MSLQPKPPHGLLFGNIPIASKVASSLPWDCHPHTLWAHIHRAYNLGAFFVADLWPLSSVKLMIIQDPAVAAQVTQLRSLPKHTILKTLTVHLVGTDSMLLAEGATWKSLRTIFNPGFSTAHLLTQTDVIVDYTQIFCKILSKHAENGEMFQMEDAATRLTIDIIGRVALDTDLHAQISDNELVNAFRHSMAWTPKTGHWNPFLNTNPVRPVLTWWYKRKMDHYLGNVIDRRFASQRYAGPHNKSKHIIDLALDEYCKQNAGSAQMLAGPDKHFKKAVIDNMKTFLFAGHDTTSSLICYVYHLLHLHPQDLAKVRQEHDEIFGIDTSKAPDMIKDNPQLLGRLPYTLAIIKETLRLYPPASTLRMGSDHVSITYNAESYPTKGFLVWVNNHAISRRADIFPSPDSFVPQRFLADAPAEIPRNAWRPFEKGPRNCIGQELALLELKIIMVLTLRSFSMHTVIEDWHKNCGKSVAVGQVDEVYGDKAYQILQSTAKPKYGMPMTVTRTALPI
ncbi:cytochrome P450 71B25 protein [Lipomyces kononenkoae]